MELLPSTLTCEEVELRCWTPKFAYSMLLAIEESLPELRQWMPWAQVTPTEESLAIVLEQGEEHFITGSGWDYALFAHDSEEVLGYVGIHTTDRPSNLQLDTGCEPVAREGA